MVLESLINPLKAEREPWEMFFIGMVYSSIAVLLSLWIFNQHASLVMVFLTVMACVPLIYTTIKMEEKKDLELSDERTLLREHGKALLFFVFLFLGIMISLSLWYVFLPNDVTSTLFSIQTQTITDINDRVTGNATQDFNMFVAIFLNNIKVMVFCILFAFLYGAGAIFILTWNASVISVAIGNFIRTNIGTTSSYFQIGSLGILRYMVHGIPEITAYFVAGLAGGIISVAVIRHDFGTTKFERILLDSTNLLVISLVMLFIAALAEVYITPILF
ncbi:MAG: stage II sporulation protein M [Nanoarchaeota archaeon]